MRRIARILGWTAAVVLGLPLLAVFGLLAALNTGPGQRLAATEVTRLSGGMVVLSGLYGRFPDALRVARVEVRDAHGPWLVARDAALDWSPLALLRAEAQVARLGAASVAVARRPEAAPGAPAPAGGAGGGFTLPVRVDVAALRVDRVEIAAGVAGAAAVLAVDGQAHLNSLWDGGVDLALRRLDAPGRYHARARFDGAGIAASLDAEEPAHGLVATLAGLPEIGALAVTASLDGPWSGAAARFAVTAGKLAAGASGRVDLSGQAAELDVTASAPAMAPRAGLSWESVALTAHVHGKLTTPEVRASASVEGLAASGATVRHLAADVSGDLGAVGLTATAEEVRIPGPDPALLAAAPLTLRADARLDQAGRPVTFALTHPLVSLRGAARTEGAVQAKAHLDLPDMAPLAALGGIALAGHAALDLMAAPGDPTTITVDGSVGVTGGMAPLPGLIGPAATLGVSVALHGQDVTLSRLAIAGQAVTLDAHGVMAAGVLDLDWRVALADLSALAATVRGAARAQGHIHGPPDHFAVRADAEGEVATQGVPSEPLKLSLAAEGLPAAPSGTVRAEGALDGAPLALDAAVARRDDGTLALTIQRADWKSAHAEGAFTLPPGADPPSGQISLRMARLDDLRPLLGQPIGGAVEARASLGEEAGRKLARLDLAVSGAGMAGTGEVAQASLQARVFDPTTDPEVDAKLSFSGLRAGGVAGSGTVTAQGRQAALAVRLQAAVPDMQGAALDATAAAEVDVPGQRATLSTLEARWKGETLRLLGPARIGYGAGVSVDRLRLGLRQAVLEVAGRAAPTLDLAVSLERVTADLARIVAPDIQAEGTLSAEAKLTGTPARPNGTVRVTASGLRLREGPGAAMPAADLTAEATLLGNSARVRARAHAGDNEITLDGTAPLAATGALDLRARGGFDLAVLEPLLAAEGRRARGRVTLDAAIAGTPSAPRAEGTLLLAGGEVQDFAQGVHIDKIEAALRASGDTIRIERFAARAGGGTLGASGSLGLAGAMPVELRVTAKNARPLASDRLTATLDADLRLKGEAMGPLALGGTITVDRADIRIPETMPAQLVVLNVRRPGQKPPPPPAPAPDIALDVTVTSPGQMFVRGRGLFAELRGRIHVVGTTAAPQPTGRFTLVRGTFNLPGTTLDFASGRVGFDGSGKLDPTLDFVANSTNGNIVATLAITGYASAPKIVLSSVPELPQDEVLAQLLFHQSASSLSGFQLAQAAAALAQISGAGGGALDPLSAVRQRLGLDRLSVGSGQNGAGASLEAGSYVAPGVFVGAKQDTSGGGGTQAEVQIDLMKGLRLQTTVGTGGATSVTGATATNDPNGTSVGLTYQFHY